MPKRATDPITDGELLDEELVDEAFRDEWGRLALARDVAARLVAYRHDEKLTQSELARRLGISQPAAARLERASHAPSHDTLARVAGLLGVEFSISIAPGQRAPQQLTSAAQKKVLGRYRSSNAIIRMSSADCA